MANELRKIPVVFYRTGRGDEVVRQWLRDLDEVDRKVIGLDLMRIQYRWPIGMPLCRALEHDEFGRNRPNSSCLCNRDHSGARMT